MSFLKHSRPVWAAALVAAAISTSAPAATLQVPHSHKTVQAAIDAAEAGDTVLVSPGTYKERIRLKPGVTVKSAGDDAKGELGLKRAEASIIDGNFESAEGPGVTMAEDATLDGFTVTGVGQYDDALWQKHYDSRGMHQSHAHIGGPGTAGISMIAVSRCRVIHNIVHHIGYTGIAITGAKDKDCSPTVHRNITYRNMAGGIGSMRGSTAQITENICFENFYAGIGHNNASPVVTGNHCYENIRAGIGVSEHAKPLIRGNTCYKNRRAGIGIRTGEDTAPIVERNECYENGMAGIGVEEDASPVIRGNRCYRNRLAGIGAREHANPTILENECFENQAAGIGLSEDSQAIVMKNYCHHNASAGIGFAECKSGKAEVSNNRFLENKTVAAGINAGWNVQFVKNEFSRSGGMPPIIMLFQGAEATFVGNSIRGEGVAGIRCAGTIHVTGNTFDGGSVRKQGPPDFGIWALPGAKGVIIGNTFSGYRTPFPSNNADITSSGNTIE